MIKTEREIKEIIVKFQTEIEKLGVKPQRIHLFGSYAGGTPREDSDIDVIVITEFRVKISKLKQRVLPVSLVLAERAKCVTFNQFF